MALAESVLQIVEETARHHGASRVRAVHLMIGRLSHVEPEALTFSFEVVTRNSIAQDAQLEIHTSEGVAWCMECSDTVSLDRLGDACPRCAGYQLQVTGGDEMRVRDIEID